MRKLCWAVWVVVVVVGALVVAAVTVRETLVVWVFPPPSAVTVIV